MSAFTVCLNAVLPIFLIMALGYAARLLGAIKRENVPALNKLLFRFFMPVMLFNSKLKRVEPYRLSATFFGAFRPFHLDGRQPIFVSKAENPSKIAC